MPEILKKIKEKALEFWGKLDKSQRTRLIVTVSVVLIAIIVSLIIVSRSTYIPLTSSEDQKVLKEITDVLTEQGLDYKMTDDKRTILINDKDKSAAQVATLGFVDEGMTFEDAFNMIKLNTTESDKERLWKEYKKKTLGSKLVSIANNIEVADVDLDIPEESTFVSSDEETRKPTARVMVKPKGNLSDEQVQGIAMMVAGSVAGLDVKDVVVLDDNLNVLNRNSNDDMMGSVNSQEELRLQKAKDLEERIYRLYGGPSDSYDGIKVVANPVIDFNKKNSITKDVMVPEGMDVDAGKGVIVSQRLENEEAKEAELGGVPGVETNPADADTPNYPIDANSGNGEYKKDTEETNYDYTRIETQEEIAVGNLVGESSSMAVALYYGRNVTDEKKMSDVFLEELLQGVSKATGIPVERISINKFKMPPLVEEKQTTSEFVQELVNSYGLFALMFLLVVGLLIAVFPKRKKEEVIPEEEIEDTGAEFIVPDDEPLPELDLEERSEVKKQIDRFVKQKPDAVAQLLRNWLSDDWD